MTTTNCKSRAYVGPQSSTASSSSQCSGSVASSASSTASCASFLVNRIRAQSFLDILRGAYHLAKEHPDSMKDALLAIVAERAEQEARQGEDGGREEEALRSWLEPLTGIVNDLVKEAGRSHSTLRKRIKRDRKKASGAPGGPRKGLFGSLATEVHGCRGRLFVGAAMREEPRVSMMDEDRQMSGGDSVMVWDNPRAHPHHVAASSTGSSSSSSTTGSSRSDDEEEDEAAMEVVGGFGGSGLRSPPFFGMSEEMVREKQRERLSLMVQSSSPSPSSLRKEVDDAVVDGVAVEALQELMAKSLGTEHCHARRMSGEVSGSSSGWESEEEGQGTQAWRRPGSAVMREVVSNSDLVGHLFSFMVGERNGRQSMRRLGQLSLVCRKWRDVAGWESWWGRIEREMVPFKGGQGTTDSGSTAMVRARAKDAARDAVIRHGRMLIRERRVWGAEDWLRGLEVHFEVFDRMDGLQMLSVVGPVGLDYYEPEDAFSTLFVESDVRIEVQGPSFAAANRDPGPDRSRPFDSIFDYFQTATSLCVRAMVRDRYTGRKALLYQEAGGVREVQEPNDLRREFLPEGSFAVVKEEPQVIICPAYTGPPLQVSHLFHVSPEPNQDMLPEEKRLYRVAGGDEERYGQHGPFVELRFYTRDEYWVAHCMRSILSR